MRFLYFLLFTFLMTVGVYSQSIFSRSQYNGFDVENSIVPKEDIFSGGPPKDGIPAILNPKFETAKGAKWLDDKDLVAGVDIKGIQKAYPIRILVWHELVNDKINNTPFLITYCPLCGSILAFSRYINDEELTFGVSGLLYQSDVLFYDHKTESLWSQLKMQSVSGKFAGAEMKLIPYTFSTWREWKDQHPNSLVLSKDTGYIRNYNSDPYLSYYSSKKIYFPVNKTNDRFHPKEKILVVLSGDKSKAYPFSYLEKIDGTFEDKIGSQIVKITSKKGKYFNVTDNNGITKEYFVSYWFAWYAFKPDTLVFKDK